MRLTIFNGSPRGQASNSKILLEQFMKGFQENNENSYEIAYLNRTGNFDGQIMHQLARRERFPLLVRLLFTLLSWTGVTNMYWNMQLKKNGAYQRRFVRPYRD
jgi:hypothetical protein